MHQYDIDLFTLMWLDFNFRSPAYAFTPSVPTHPLFSRRFVTLVVFSCFLCQNYNMRYVYLLITFVYLRYQVCF